MDLKNLPRRSMLIRRRPFLASLLATPALLQPAYAQASFPDRPLRLVVPFPPGGGTDAFARRFATRLGQELGQTIVVENRTGAAGAIGVQEVLRSRADGYTLLFGGASTHALYPLVFARPQYDPVEDFTQVALLGANTVCFIARKGVADNLGDLLAQARRRPGELRFGSPGAGTYVHLAGEYLLQAAEGHADAACALSRQWSRDGGSSGWQYRRRGRYGRHWLAPASGRAREDAGCCFAPTLTPCA